MRNLDTRRSLQTFWDDVVYTEAALLADDETAALAAALTEHLADHERVAKIDRDSRRATLQAGARANVADGGVDEGIRDLHNDTLHDVQQDRSERRYATLFPQPLNRMIRHALARQLEGATEIVERLGLSLFTEAFRDRHRGSLGALIERGRAALASRRTAALQRTEARLEIQAWKEETNALRLGIYSQLLSIAAQQRHNRRWAEQFFMRHRSSSGVEEELIEDIQTEDGEGTTDTLETPTVG